MTDYKTPEKFRLYRIIAMYYTVSRVNYGFCIRQWKVMLYFQNTVYSLPIISVLRSTALLRK